MTVLSLRRPGDFVNIEADILGKYVRHYMNGAADKRDVTMDFLAKHGYV
jgi:riboflavin synthase